MPPLDIVVAVLCHHPKGGGLMPLPAENHHPAAQNRPNKY